MNPQTAEVTVRGIKVRAEFYYDDGDTGTNRQLPDEIIITRLWADGEIVPDCLLEVLDGFRDEVEGALRGRDV